MRSKNFFFNLQKFSDKKKTRRNPKLYPEQRIIHRDEEQEFLLQLSKIGTQQQKERNSMKSKTIS